MGDGKKHDGINVRGLVTASGWDDDATVTGISILTFDEEEYEVYLDDVGKYLSEHLRHEVLIRGRLMPGYRKRNVIRVKSFTVFGPESTEN